jgi:cytochrome P450
MKSGPAPADREGAASFDQLDPAYNRQAPQLWAELRGRCPMAHSTLYGGTWLPLTYEYVREIAYDTRNFTSEGVIASTDRPVVPRPAGAAPPITSDPPFHADARRLLLPAFSPKRAALMEPEIRALCRERLDRLGSVVPGRTVIEAATDYALHIPMGVIVRMIGVPSADEALFVSFLRTIIEGANASPEVLSAARDRLDAYLDEQIADHRARPRDDLITYLIDARFRGEPLDPQHIRGTIALLLLAGIDTTWSVIGASLWHLASHPADLRRLREEPALMDTAVEELLRAYAPVTMARLVVSDHDFHGHALKKDEWVLLPFPAANRDPAAFESPDEVRLDREENRHATFGLGIHRCIGSNLARLELRIALEEFIARFPAFTLDDPDSVQWSAGQIRGPRRLALRILP